MPSAKNSAKAATPKAKTARSKKIQEMAIVDTAPDVENGSETKKEVKEDEILGKGAADDMMALQHTANVSGLYC